MKEHRVNKDLVDIWTIMHFIAAFFLAMVICVVLRNLPMTLVLGTILIVLWEVFERWLKKYYDLFNIPFGHKTIYESNKNSLIDILAGELGILFFWSIIVFC
jgi:hypothetical protein